MQADEFRALRKAAGLNQAELAERLGLSPGFIGEMERGEKLIGQRTEMALMQIVLPKRDTAYAREIASAEDANGQRIERIYVKDRDQEEIRFSWWPDGKMAVRPLDLPEEDLLPLMRLAIRNNVFSRDFLKGLHQALYDERQQD